MTCPINTQRAGWAAVALDAFQCSVWEDDETAIADLIADLGHLAKKQQLDYVAILRRGIGNWAFEEREPNGLVQTPPVSIRIGLTRPKRHPQKRVAKGGAK